MKVELEVLDRYNFLYKQLDQLHLPLSEPQIPEAQPIPPICQMCGVFLVKKTEQDFECPVCKSSFKVKTITEQAKITENIAIGSGTGLYAIAERPVIVSGAWLYQKAKELGVILIHFDSPRYRNVIVLGVEFVEKLKEIDNYKELEERKQKIEREIQKLEEQLGELLDPRKRVVEFTLTFKENEYSMDEPEISVKVRYEVGWEIKIYSPPETPIEEMTRERIETVLKDFFGDYPVIWIS